MRNLMKPVELLRAIRTRQEVSGQDLLRAYRALPTVAAVQLLPQFDDSDDIQTLLISLTDAERAELGLNLPEEPTPLAPAPPSAQSGCQVRVHAILCANDDGSGGASSANAIDATFVEKLVDATNVIYQNTGIQFVYDPATDFEKVNSSLLNLDFTVPTGLNFNLPESKPPLNKEQMIKLKKPHTDERQKVGRQHRHKMVLLFCDGNQLVYAPDDLWHRWFNGNWSDWERLEDGVLASDPAAVSWGKGRIDVFARGTDKALWHRWYDGMWSDKWISRGGVLSSDPDVASWGPGRLDVFVRGADKALWHKWFDNGSWSGWQSLGGELASDPAAVSWGNGRIDVFVPGADKALWHKWYDGTWSDWESLGGVLTSGPGVASWASGHLDVFVRGADNALWHKWFDNGSWSGWQSLGGDLTSDPAAVSWGKGRIDVFARGVDNALWHKWYDGEWSNWESLGGVLASGPDVTSWGPGHLDVFVKNKARWMVTPRTFAFSGDEAEFVALPTGQGHLQGFANLVAHETGHYFHLWHTFGPAPESISDAGKIIKNAVEIGYPPGVKYYSKKDAHLVFDGDRDSNVIDTNPDPRGSVLAAVNKGNACGPQGEVKVKVQFSDGTNEEYTLNPDRGNVMSYFKGCLNFKMHFSPQQMARMRRSIEEGNRWHLCHPSMRLHTLSVYTFNNQPFFCAVWHPSEEPEIQVYDWPQKELRAKYDELWPQGWRLKLLSPYVLNGQVRYAAVWKPGTEDEVQVYDWPQKELRAKYDELWPQGWRLKLLSPYVLNGQVRYAAVWKPGTEGEVQVYDWPQKELRAKYDELWPQGWRLKLLSPYVLNGQVRYAAVWKPGTEGEVQVYDWPQKELRAKYDELWPQGWRLKLLSPYVLNGQVRYAAVWKPGTEGEVQVYDWPQEDVRTLYDRMW